MKLPKRLAAARKKAGLSQADLAERLGVSTGTVGGWETPGKKGHGIRLGRLPEIARVLKTTVAELLA